MVVEGGELSFAFATHAAAFNGVGELLVKRNLIDDCCNGIVQDSGTFPGSVSMENHHLSSVGARSGGAKSLRGISGAGVNACTIPGSSLRGFGSVQSLEVRTGIATAGASRVRLSGNELLEVAAGSLLAPLRRNPDLQSAACPMYGGEIPLTIGPSSCVLCLAHVV